MSGVIDEPLTQHAKDELGIKEYSKALSKFITTSESPMTVGIQGEWGSGKTSLLQLIKNDISQQRDADNRYKQIWVNTWEHSLLRSPQETLVSIISQILRELTDENGDIRKKTKKIFEGAFRVGASIVAGTAGANVVEEYLEVDDSSHVKALRKTISEHITQKRFERVIVYIDDLDRIQPAEAVELLELLKNIFNIKKCIFVLAIDYDVVIQGLEKKFGEITAANKRKYDFFFHKLIQLAFRMPSTNDKAAEYLQKLLERTGFIKAGELPSEHLNRLLEHTIRFNPRSIKRLVNQITLNKLVRDLGQNKKALDQKNKYVLVAVNCIQIHYPYFYAAISEKPKFKEWNGEFANKYVNRSAQHSTSQTFDDLDEKMSDWGKAVATIICSADNGTIDGAIGMYEILADIVDEHSDDYAHVMEDAIKQTNVTQTVEGTPSNKSLSIEEKRQQFNQTNIDKEGAEQFFVLVRPCWDEPSIHVSLKKTGSSLNGKTYTNQDGTKTPQYLYLENPKKAGSSGVTFYLKRQSGLNDWFTNELKQRSVAPPEEIDELIQERKSDTKYPHSLASKFSENEYSVLLAELGNRIRDSILKDLAPQ